MAVESDSRATLLELEVLFVEEGRATSEDSRTISGASTCTSRISGVGTDAAGLMTGKDSFSFTLAGLGASTSGEGTR
jgi:hypothetical protein